jgi:hypothetical protein
MLDHPPASPSPKDFSDDSNLAFKHIAKQGLAEPVLMTAPYHLSSTRVDRLPHDLAEAQLITKNLPCLPLRQPWQAEPDANFKTGQVRSIWDEISLGVYAEMEDDDIFNDATRSDQPTWVLGDVFEMFLRPLSSEQYFELHVTPSNVQLRVLFASEAFFWEQAALNKGRTWIWPYCLPDGAFASSVQITSGGWSVWARIPWLTLQGGQPPQPGDSILASFCRYDATRLCAQPVLSTTGNYQEKKFHLQSGWHALLFQ